MVRRGRVKPQQYTHRGYHAKHPREARFYKKLLKQVSNNKIRLAVTSSHVLTSLIRNFTKELVDVAIEATIYRGKGTLTARSIQCGLRVCLGGGQLLHFAIVHGMSAVTKMHLKDKPIIPVSYIRNQIKSSLTRLRVAKDACVYLSAVIEYLCFEILELSFNTANNMKLTQITPRHIFLSINDDPELCKAFNKPGTVFVQGGSASFHVKNNNVQE
ncbi:hypothetical protein CYY_008507 [Polysphondylium violaceum]|uniref:Histone H2A n=1 Tax=Polysphondylium violaceum TaxID=133409 RepID=A0A8J4PLI6_9MYCE|nr:hypothetical protein CYY_008507 [Polysphondylium violaceum]